MVLEEKSRPRGHDSQVFLAGDFFRQRSASTEKQNPAKVLPGIASCQILVTSDIRRAAQVRRSAVVRKDERRELNIFFWWFRIWFPVL